MSDKTRRQIGEEKIKDVYAGDGIVPGEGDYAFSDIMLETLFAEIWTRDVLSMRDKRILLLGMIAAQGQPDTDFADPRGEAKRQAPVDPALALARSADIKQPAPLLNIGWQVTPGTEHKHDQRDDGQ